MVTTPSPSRKEQALQISNKLSKIAHIIDGPYLLLNISIIRGFGVLGFKVSFSSEGVNLFINL